MILSFLIISAIGCALLLVTSVIVYELFARVWQILLKVPNWKHARVIVVVFPIFVAHILNIWLYAVVFFLLHHYADLGQVINVNLPLSLDRSFADCLYFSGVSYTTLGFGDFVANGTLRMLSATEALNGLVLMGWTISFTYLAMEDFWKNDKGI